MDREAKREESGEGRKEENREARERLGEKRKRERSKHLYQKEPDFWLANSNRLSDG